MPLDIIAVCDMLSLMNAADKILALGYALAPSGLGLRSARQADSHVRAWFENDRGNALESRTARDAEMAMDLLAEALRRRVEVWATSLLHSQDADDHDLARELDAVLSEVDADEMGLAS